MPNFTFGTHIKLLNVVTCGVDMPKGDSPTLLFYSAFWVVFDFLSILTLCVVALFTQPAPFALFYDLDVTPDFSSPLFMSDGDTAFGSPTSTPRT